MLCDLSRFLEHGSSLTWFSCKVWIITFRYEPSFKKLFLEEGGKKRKKRQKTQYYIFITTWLYLKDGEDQLDRSCEK